MRAAQSLPPDSLSPAGQQKKEIKMIPRDEGALPDKSQDAAANEAIQKILHPEIEIKVPERRMNCLCPITNLLMRDPVTTADGHTYEREAIEEWLATHDTSPKTNDRLLNKSLIPALSRKEIIDELIEDHPEWKDSSDWYLPKKWIEELRMACQAGDEKTIQSLAQRDRRLLVQAFEEKYTGQRAVHLAAVGHPAALDTVIGLLEKRQPGLALEMLCQPDEAGYLPLHRAILAHCPAEILFKLSRWMGARLTTIAPLSPVDREAKDAEGHTPLHRAIMAGSMEMMQWLLAQQADIKAVNHQGESVLHFAAQMNRADMLTVFLEKGASLHAKNHAGNTVLHSAAQEGAIEVVVALLRMGISPDIKNAASQTPRQCAQAHQGRAFMLAYDKAVSQCAAGEEEVIRSQGVLGVFLLKQQQIIQTQQERIEFLLAEMRVQAAKIQGQEAEIKILKRLPREMEHLRQVEIKPLMDWRASLLSAENRKQTAAVASAREAKLKTEREEKQRLELLPLQNELVAACEQGDLKAVQLSIQKGAKPFFSNAAGKQPLGAAVWGMNPEVVNYLLTKMEGNIPMNWIALEKHNGEQYHKELFMFDHFNPQTHGEWHALLQKMDANPFLKPFHLTEAGKVWVGLKKGASWDELKADVREAERTRRQGVTGSRRRTAAEKTEERLILFRTQIQSAIEEAVKSAALPSALSSPSAAR